MKKVVDTDDYEYENEEVFLADVLDVVGNHLKKFGGMAWDEWWTRFHAITSIYC